MKRRIVCLFVLILCLCATGCGRSWKRKFIRKNKIERPPDAILVLESNEKATHPPAIRYQEHFAYWKSWHSELLGSLGDSPKRDLTYLAGTISELRSMGLVLTGPPSERLRRILGELGQMQENWEQDSPGSVASSRTRTRLEQLKREIDRELYYSKVKAFILEEKSPAPEKGEVPTAHK